MGGLLVVCASLVSTFFWLRNTRPVFWGLEAGGSMLGAVNIFKVLQEYWTWGKPWKGAQKWNHSGVPPLLAQKMTQKSLCKCFASVQFTWMHKLSASKVYVRANSPCLSPLCPKVYLSERKWFVFCSCKSRFLQINVDPGFRFSVSGVTFVSRSVISCSSRQTWSFTPNKMLSSHPCNYLIGYSWEKYTPVAGDIPR
jgi:hypothetical protein